MGAGEGLGAWSPPADVRETAEELVVILELPGFEQHEIELRVEGDALVVEGERKLDRNGPREHFHRI